MAELMTAKQDTVTTEEPAARIAFQHFMVSSLLRLVSDVRVPLFPTNRGHYHAVAEERCCASQQKCALMSQLGHSRRSRFGRESVCPPISDMTGSCQFRRDVPIPDMSRCRGAARTVASSRNGIYGTSGDHSGLMPANLITFAHFSVSLAMRFLKAAGDSTRGVAPNPAMRAFILGSTRATLISLLSVSRMSTGVFLGAPMPNHTLTSKPGTDSPTVGMSGNSSKRFGLVTASARNLPLLTCSSDTNDAKNAICTCPPSRSVIAGPAPRYGM